MTAQTALNEQTDYTQALQKYNRNLEGALLRVIMTYRSMGMNQMEETIRNAENVIEGDEHQWAKEAELAWSKVE